ncbi:unnamed protein product, partial [Urochloa humidicola]
EGESPAVRTAHAAVSVVVLVVGHRLPLPPRCPPTRRQPHARSSGRLAATGERACLEPVHRRWGRGAEPRQRMWRCFCRLHADAIHVSWHGGAAATVPSLRPQGPTAYAGS